VSTSTTQPYGSAFSVMSVIFGLVFIGLIVIYR
jgi:hypothetical protein